MDKTDQTQNFFILFKEESYNKLDINDPEKKKFITTCLDETLPLINWETLANRNCNAIFQNGKNRDKHCTALAYLNFNYCKKHLGQSFKNTNIETNQTLNLYTLIEKEFYNNLNIDDQEKKKYIITCLSKTLPLINWKTLTNRTCKATFQNGKNKGKNCTNQACLGYDYCKQHIGQTLTNSDNKQNQTF